MRKELELDRYLTFPEAAASLPGKPSVSTIHRWRLKGVRGIRLSTVVIGGRRFVDRAALEDFIRATTLARDGPPPSEDRSSSIASAESYLDQAGLR